MAEKKIEEELDIVNFVKQMKYLKVIMSVLFSKQERYLIKKNRRFIVSKKKLYQDGDESDSLDP